MSDALVSALCGFSGVVVGAMLTRSLTDRADRVTRLRTAYADWFLALTHHITGRVPTGFDPNTYERDRSVTENALVRTRWVLRLVETDRSRMATVNRLTEDVLNRRYSKALDDEIEAVADDIGQRFSSLLDSSI